MQDKALDETFQFFSRMRTSISCKTFAGCLPFQNVFPDPVVQVDSPKTPMKSGTPLSPDSRENLPCYLEATRLER